MRRAATAMAALTGTGLPAPAGGGARDDRGAPDASLRGASPLDDGRARILPDRVVAADVRRDALRGGAAIARVLREDLPRLHAERAVSEATLRHRDHALSQLPLEVR